MTELPRAQLAAWALAAVLLAVAGAKLLAPHRGAQAMAPARVEQGSGGGPAAAGGAVFVHVAGAVHRPGLLRLPRGARVATAVERAGGPAHGADLSGVNLAARVEDGQQILVPRRGTAPAGLPAAESGSSAAGAMGAKVSLASASAEQLDGIDGIGPTLAKRIVEYRQAHGGFRSIQELREVEGIGEKRFARLRESLQP